MKHLILIGGTMGVGKTAVCQKLKEKLSPSVFLDGDWCWDANPFTVTDETKAMVNGNIRYLLSSFLHCSAYEYVIFGWVMHLPEVIENATQAAAGVDCTVHAFSLIASPETVTERLRKDCNTGIRTPDVIDRATAYLALYDHLDTVKIDTNGKSLDEIADLIIAAVR